MSLAPVVAVADKLFCQLTRLQLL